MVGVSTWVAAYYLAAASAGTGALGESQKPIASSKLSKNPLTEEFGSFVNATMHKWKVPGVSIAVIDGEDIYAEGYGYATLPDVKATPDTLWYGASTSKAQTAAVLSRLIHSRKYPALSKGWTTPISSLIREDFVLSDGWATDHITLDDAVSHRTGVVGHDMATVASNESNADTIVRDTVRNLRNLPAGGAEPRTVYMYNNNMFVTLSHVLETLTGQWLGDLLRKHLWAPLGMDATFFDLQDAKDAKNHLADGYYWDEEGAEYKFVNHLHVAAASGAGAVLSSALDYAKWVRCLLHEGAPLSKAVHKDIKTPRMITSGPVSGLDIELYALGWNRGTYNGHVVYTHSGGMHAFGAEVFWVPEAKFGAVAFGNTAISSNVVQEVAIYKLLDEKLGIPEEKRFDIGAFWQKRLDEAEEDLKDPVKKLYPDAPEKRIPSPFKTSDLAGTYTDAGYGTFTFREESHDGKSVLVAHQTDLELGLDVTLEHVSGDYWTFKAVTHENPTLMTAYFAAEFTRGADGKVATLVVDWSAASRGDGKTAFRRV